MLALLDNYDWEEVFKYAQTPTWTVNKGRGPATPFIREDVVEVLGMADGEREGLSWVGAFRLRDGRYASVEAGCDYTGWG